MRFAPSLLIDGVLVTAGSLINGVTSICAIISGIRYNINTILTQYLGPDRHTIRTRPFDPPNWPTPPVLTVVSLLLLLLLLLVLMTTNA